MNRAFLSHSSKQKHLVQQIAQNLGKDRCVFDAYEFESGMPILDEILKGITNTDLIVLFLSNDSLNSHWVQIEISEAKRQIDELTSKKIYPILIDKSISVSTDLRIPDWLKKYLLKPLMDPFLITKKINQKLRELSIESNPLFKAKESLFVGRNETLDYIESKIFTISKEKPKTIIINGLEGIGRRTVIKRCLKQFGKIQEFYEPIYISLGSKDSIEDFILKLQDFNKATNTQFLSDLREMDFKQKIEKAKSLLINVQNNQEYVIIIDFGCIVKPSKQVAEWYLDLINDPKHLNELTLCVASRFRPSNGLLKNNKKILNYNLSTLPEKDTEKLFAKYSAILELELEEEGALKILKILNGIPSQIHYAVEYIKDYGIKDAIKNKQEIIDFGETQVYYLIDLVKKKGTFAYDLLLLISKFEFVSYEMIYSIVGNKNKVNELLDEFYILGVFDLVGANKEYIKVHFTLFDYLMRAKSKLKPEFTSKLRKSIKKFVTSNPNEAEFTDISELLFNIKGAILNGYKLPKQYYIPSFVLKTIVELYYKGKYKTVISLIDKILENSSRLEPSLVREFRYWLCLCLARLSKKRFEKEVDNIDGADYNYLYGFYFRFKKQFDTAQKYLNWALESYPKFQRAKRELVNILLLKEDYNEALDMAKSNYENQKLNALHIQAFFICLIRKKYLTKKDKDKIDELFKNIQRSYDFRAKEIANVMKGEFEFYVEKNNGKAIEILRNCLKVNSNKHYALKALEDIYKKSGLYSPLSELKITHQNLFNNKTFSD